MVFAWQEDKDITGDDQQKSQCQDLCAPKRWAIENTGKFTKLNQTQLLIAHSSFVPYPASLHLSAPVLLMKQLRRRGKKKKKSFSPTAMLDLAKLFSWAERKHFLWVLFVYFA